MLGCATRYVARVFATSLALAATPPASRADALKLHPENTRYFLFNNRPLVLLTATEHYGSVLNRAFDFEKYLDDAVLHRMTMTRTFLLFRELQGARNPSSPCKPESPDYLAPFPRTGPGKALDGEPIYDLDQWNREYFDRLKRFLDAAAKRGIIVELTIFSNTYADNIWALNPFRAENNKQKVGRIGWQEYTSLRDPELVRRQAEYARKIVRETAAYDNIYYEICNEPGGAIPDHPSAADVDAWQQEMGRAIRDELEKLKQRRLIAGQQAFAYQPKFRFPLNETYSGSLFDIVNVHPLPDTELRGQLYQLGNFMSKELMLAEMQQFTAKAYQEGKPTVMDEDNAASLYRDQVGWSIHRKRAWTTLLNGGHYDYIDFSITVGSEAGTPASRRGIRDWMEHLSEFIAGFDFVHARPDLDWIQSKPEQVVASALVVQNTDYALYLADSREVTDTSAGQPIKGTIAFKLPAGRFLVRLYSPVSGEYSPGWVISGGGRSEFQLPPFEHDLVLRVTRTAR
jgi:hypothetical protein